MNKSIIVALNVFCYSYLFSSHAPWFSVATSLDDIRESLNRGEFFVNSRNEFGLTGLMVAADKGNYELARLLLLFGADVNLKSKDSLGNTALHLVVSDFNDANRDLRLPLLQILLEHGADSSATNFKGQVPLHCLITVDNVKNLLDPLNMLIFYGSPCNKRDGRGATFLHNLVELRASEALALIQSHYKFLFDEKIKNNKNYTPLQYAKSIRCDECITKFTDPKNFYRPSVVVNNYDTNGLTYLMVASFAGDLNEAKKYNDDKGDLNLMSNNIFRYTALHCALIAKNIKVAEWLLDNQARTDIQNARGYTAAHLFIAIGGCDNNKSMNYRDIVLKIIDKNPKILNMQNNEGNTIMHTLVYRNNYTLIKILTQKYYDVIDLTIRNNNTKTPLDIAKLLSYQSIIEMLKKIQDT